MLRNFVRRWLFNEDLEEIEREVLSVLAEGKGKEARSWRRVANRTGDAEARKKAEEAARETIRLTRMVNGMRDLYTYGRAGDE